MYRGEYYDVGCWCSSCICSKTVVPVKEAEGLWILANNKWNPPETTYWSRRTWENKNAQ
jgi:hypothetical protein